MYGVGTILAGKYRVERLLGEGGMGIVVAATHVHLGSQVALKFLHAAMATSQQMGERFMREARASALLKSEHVCRVSDVGVLDNGAPYIVMELLSGQDLSSILRTHGPLSIPVAADYMLQACTGIAEAHAAGIVHRDLKPGNLFWTQRTDGATVIKVLDFGIAKAPGSSNFSMTQTSAVMGSPGYMSPEQLKSSKEVDARSDIWSLGCVLYELVTGRPPFHGESITELAVRVVMDPTPLLPGTFPKQFEAVITRCLEKDPAKRFQDVAELAMALAPFAGPRGIESAHGITRVLRGAHAAPIAVSSVGRTTPTTLGAATGMMSEPPRKSRGGVIAAVAGVGIVGGIIALAMTMGGGEKRAASSSEPAAATAPPATPLATPTESPTTTPPVAIPAPPPTATPSTTAASPATTTPPADATPSSTVTPPATAAATTEPLATTPAESATAPATSSTTTTKSTTATTTKTPATTSKSTSTSGTKPVTRKKKKPEDVGDSRL